MDYQGQLLCERLNQAINIVFGVIGFGWGWYVQSFWLTFLCCCGGLALSTLVCVPDWPFYNRAPLAWQKAEPVAGQTLPDGSVVPDTNPHCGTCACGTSVHGIGCESHPDNAGKKAAAAVEGEAEAGEPAAAEEAKEENEPSGVVEVQSVKVSASRGSKKKKAKNAQ